jgi:glycosyltransferase involved in cell wall biosynthesis
MSYSEHIADPHPSHIISVIMLTINRPQYISSAIESVRKQTYGYWELIIVHDGSDNRITEATQPWLVRDERIRYFHRENIGNIANGLNYGLKHSNGSFVAVLDDDDAWLNPRKLEMQVNCLNQNPQVACVGGGAIVVDNAGSEIMRYLKPLNPSECRAHALLANPVIHSTVMFRRTAAAAVCFYDERLRGYQDWDLWLKIMQNGDVVNLPEYFATYRIWDGGGSSRNVMSNAWSGFRIVNRHRAHFPKYGLALAAAVGYLLFSTMPTWIRKCSYQYLSKIKKHLFSN